MMTSSNGNIFRVTGHFCGEFTGPRWIPRQWRGALMFSLIYVWINDRVNNRETGDLRRYRAHYYVIVMNFLETVNFRKSVIVLWFVYIYASHWFHGNHWMTWYALYNHDIETFFMSFRSSDARGQYGSWFPLIRVMVWCPDDTCTINLVWASCQIHKIAGCACAGYAGNVFPATVGKRSRHASRQVRDARAVMHAEIANKRFPLKLVAGKTFPAFPAHAQPTILRIFQEAHKKNWRCIFLKTSSVECLPLICWWTSGNVTIHECGCG